MPLAPGTRLGPYEIVAPLGAGGMGEVYRARHTRLERDVAVKVLSERLAGDPAALERFEREAKAVAALSHPNILAIHDLVVENGVAFAAMELLDGQTVRGRLSSGPLPWRKAVEIAAAIADGLAAAHAKGIVHRDLKPENLFLTVDGQVKILDFGLARSTPAQAARNDVRVSTAEVRTEPGVVMGTLGYMSPEQATGQRAEAPSDIFSLGCVLFEMLTSSRAFSGKTATEILAAILKEDPPDPSSVDPLIPAEVGRVLHHCLEKNPAERFQSARDLAFALRAATTASGALGAGTASARWPRTLLAGAVAAALLVAVGVAVVKSRAENGHAIDSLAVLPFANASGNPDAEYLSEGIAESLINGFSRLHRLRVVPRTTALRYKGSDAEPETIGRELKVRAVLTGRVTQRGDTLSVQTELIGVDEGAQLWGEQYNRKMSDILAVQEEISRDISRSLKLKLSGEEEKRLVHRGTQNPLAYQSYLRARYHLQTWDPEGVKKGIAAFDDAIRAEPGYAAAHAGLAEAYLMAGALYMPPQESSPKARAAATRALEIDEGLADAHSALATIKYVFEWDWEGSDREFRRALELDPEYVWAHDWYGFQLALRGRSEEAERELRRALELEPLAIAVNVDLGEVLRFGRRYDAALDQYRKLGDLDAGFWLAHWLVGLTEEHRGEHAQAEAEFREAARLLGEDPQSSAGLGYAAALSGRPAEARKALEELKALSRRRYVSAYWFAILYMSLGDKDRAFESLGRACDERAFWATFVKVDPILDPLRSDPRFALLVRRVGLNP